MGLNFRVFTVLLGLFRGPREQILKCFLFRLATKLSWGRCWTSSLLLSPRWI